MRIVILPTDRGYDTAINPAHVVSVEPGGQMHTVRGEHGRAVGNEFVPTPGAFDVQLTHTPDGKGFVTVQFDGTLEEFCRALGFIPVRPQPQPKGAT